MNCQLCQKNLDAYREGKLSSDMMTQVESHLRTCISCEKINKVQILADRIITHEKGIEVNPFLLTRVMAGIENPENAGSMNEPMVVRTLRPILISISLAAAVFIGVMLGNLSRSADMFDRIPDELALINDASMESVTGLSKE